MTAHQPDDEPGATGSSAEAAGTPGDNTAALTAALLAEESVRRDAQARAAEQVLFADDLLPGVGDEEMPLRKGLAMGGAFTFVVLLVLNSLDELEQAAMAVLAPDIRDSFGVSDGTITFIASASAAFVVLGAFPMGWLADRIRRAPIVGVASAVFSAMVFLSGFAVNGFMLFCTRFGAGIAKSNTIPVHSSLLADAYPIGVRGRIGGLTQSTGRAVAAISPIAVGTVTLVAGGDEGWRWVSCCSPSRCSPTCSWRTNSVWAPSEGASPPPSPVSPRRWCFPWWDCASTVSTGATRP